MKSNPEQDRYAAMGVAALLPGMQYMVEIMQTKLDEMRTLLAHAQNGATRTRAKKSAGAQSGWAGMTPEERSIEMKRRQAVARAKGGRGTAAATRWAKATQKQKAEWKAKMQAGRRRAQRAAKRTPVAKLAQGAAA